MNSRSKKITDKLQQLIDAKATHPFARWSVIDPNAHPDCAALLGKAWRVDSVSLLLVVDEHLSANIKGCRCNLVGMTQKTLNTTICIFID